MMNKIKGSQDDVKTINMLNLKMSKQITPLKILLDDDSEIRATNFHGQTKTGRTYISPQIVFVRATGRQRSIDISFPIHQIHQIIDALIRIKNENCTGLRASRTESQGIPRIGRGVSKGTGLVKSIGESYETRSYGWTAQS